MNSSRSSQSYQEMVRYMTFRLGKRGVVVGAVYGLIAMLIILLGPQVAQWLAIGIASTTSPTLAAVMEIFALIVGALLGLFIGVLSGIVSGFTLGLLARPRMYRSSDSKSRRTWLGALTGIIGGLIALAALTALGSPFSLTPGSPLLGRILLVIVPPIVVLGVVWWETNKLLVGNGTAHP